VSVSAMSKPARRPPWGRPPGRCVPGSFVLEPVGSGGDARSPGGAPRDLLTGMHALPCYPHHPAKTHAGPKFLGAVSEGRHPSTGRVSLSRGRSARCPALRPHHQDRGNRRPQREPDRRRQRWGRSAARASCDSGSVSRASSQSRACQGGAAFSNCHGVLSRAGGTRMNRR
jgi:hypothetical protein